MVALAETLYVYKEKGGNEMSNVIEQERYTCAIGALQSVVAIPKAVPILHSGPGM